VSAAELIDDLSFWKRVEDSLKLLKSIGEMVTYLEGGIAPIFMAPALYVRLLRSYKKLASLPDNDAFPFKSLDLKPADFVDSRVHTAKTLPDLLRRRWNEMTAHTVNPPQPAEFSSLLHLALYLDEGTRALIFHCIQEGIDLDAGRSVADGVSEGARILSKRLLDDGRYPMLKLEFE